MVELASLERITLTVLVSTGPQFAATEYSPTGKLGKTIGSEKAPEPLAIDLPDGWFSTVKVTGASGVQPVPNAVNVPPGNDEGALRTRRSTAP